MVTLMAPSHTSHLALEASGIPCLDDGIEAEGREDFAPVEQPASHPAAVCVRVESVQAPLAEAMLAWGSHDGRPVLFSVDVATGHELEHALASGERPFMLVDPHRILGAEIDVLH